MRSFDVVVIGGGPAGEVAAGRMAGDRLETALIERELVANRVEPQQIIFEITETTAVSNIPQAQEFAAHLNALGCRFALDDFGAAFASFYYLKHLPFDYLKIDGEFIRNLCHTPTDRLVVQAVVGIAQGLEMRTIAEFVGDEPTRELLGELGVDFGQGYHLGRPAPLEERLPYLRADGEIGSAGTTCLPQIAVSKSSSA